MNLRSRSAIMLLSLGGLALAGVALAWSFRGDSGSAQSPDGIRLPHVAKDLGQGGPASPTSSPTPVATVSPSPASTPATPAQPTHTATTRPGITPLPSTSPGTTPSSSATGTTPTTGPGITPSPDLPVTPTAIP